MAAKREDININDLIAKYLQGFSVKALSEFFNISRTAIIPRLRRAGIRPRNRSEAMYLRMAQTTSEEKARLAEKAHDAVRGKPKSFKAAAKQAKKKQLTHSQVGKGEYLLASWLEERGLSPVLQEAVGKYNIDISCCPVAVELLVNASNPFARATDRKKIEYLTNRNWTVIYVWVTKRHFLSEEAAEYIVSLFERTHSDPTLRGSYWVIRGSGELYATSCSNSN